MEVPLECSFEDVTPTEAIESLIRDKVEALERFHGGITSCHVHVRAPHRSQERGNLYEVMVEVRVPGTELAVHHTQKDSAEREHLKVAIRDAFSVMARKLKAWKQKVRGDVKVHDGPLQGKIVEIHHDDDYGQIITTDHRLIYFHRNSVVDGSFDDLNSRDPVELVVQTGGERDRATGKHRTRDRAA